MKGWSSSGDLVIASPWGTARHPPSRWGGIFRGKIARINDLQVEGASKIVILNKIGAKSPESTTYERG